MASKTVSNRTTGFLAGRDMAVTMLRKVDEDPDVWTLEYELREGRPQTAVLRQQLEVAMRNTDMLDGFLAVLTDRLGQAPLDLDLIQELTVENMLGETSHG